MSAAYFSKERRSFIPEKLADIHQVIHQVVCGDEDIKSAGVRKNQARENHGSFMASAAILLTAQDGGHSHEQQEIPDTSAPSNTPILTPSNSFPKAVMYERDKETSTANAQEALSTGTSFFNLSLLSDTSEDDDECNLSSLSCLDTLLCSRYEAPQRSSLSLQSHSIGLGITGMTRKNDQIPFDGLGLVGMHSESPSSYNHASPAEAETNAYNAFGEVSSHSFISDDSSGTLSETFLQEVLLTFAKDPFHSRTVSPIPECKSWYELETLSQRPPTFHPAPSSAQYCSARYHNACHGISVNSSGLGTTKLKRNFSSATISSELKRCDKVRSAGVATSRGRSTSWPITSNSPSFRDKNGGRHDRTVAAISRSAWQI